MTVEQRIARLYALRQGAEAIANPQTALGRRARVLIAESTGLSAEGVEYGLSECLELRGGRAALSQLVRRAPAAPRAHVLLSANVFIGAYRAIALALCQSTRTFVRASSRESSLAELLHEASGGAFELSSELSPQPGDHFWVYGSDHTLDSLRETLPAGVHFHGHGSGMGVALVREPRQHSDAEVAQAADALAQDTIAFDQRGCLSPRIVLMEGSDDFVSHFATQLASALTGWEAAVPRGELSPEEQADARLYADAMTFAQTTLPAGKGLVTVDSARERLFAPPVGRHLQLCRTEAPLERLKDLGPKITTVAFWGAERLPGQCEEILGPRRYVELGQMQRPPLDGPVDRRKGWDAELL